MKRATPNIRTVVHTRYRDHWYTSVVAKVMLVHRLMIRACALGTSLLVVSWDTAARPDDSQPVYPGASVSPPRETEPGCSARAVRLPKGVDPVGTVSLKFAVSPTGQLDHFSLLLPPGALPDASIATTAALKSALITAVQSCRWAPGKSGEDPVLVWAVQPFSFGGVARQPGASSVGSPGAGSGRPPATLDENCVAKHARPPRGVSVPPGEVSLLVLVDADGYPSTVKAEDPGLHPQLEDALTLAVYACSFTPGVSPDGHANSQWVRIRLHSGAGGQPGASASREDGTAKPTFLSTEAEFGGPEQAAYFNRIKNATAAHWDPMKYARPRDPDGSKFFNRDRSVALAVTLDDHGVLLDVRVARSSGLAFLDDSAIEAFREAQPFPDPPQALIGKNGRIRFTFGFLIETGKNGK